MRRYSVYLNSLGRIVTNASRDGAWYDVAEVDRLIDDMEASSRIRIESVSNLHVVVRRLRAELDAMTKERDQAEVDRDEARDIYATALTAIGNMGDDLRRALTAKAEMVTVLRRNAREWRRVRLAFSGADSRHAMALANAAAVDDALAKHGGE